MADFLTLSDLYAGNAGAVAQSNAAQPQQQTAQQEENIRRYLEGKKADADRDYNLKKRELDQQKDVAKANAKNQKEKNAIDKWYNEQSIALAGQRLAQEQQQFTAKLEFDKQTTADRLAFDKVGQAQQFGLSQARQGYDLLNMQANLRGPQNYYQAAELARGVGAQPGTATFLDALKNNTNLVGYGAQAGVPDKANVNALAAQLGYTGPTIVPGAGSATAGTGTNDDQNLAAIRGIYGAGAQKLGAGALENLTDTERKLLESGIGASGGDFATFLDQYRRSRVGQSYGNAAAA